MANPTADRLDDIRTDIMTQQLASQLVPIMTEAARILRDEIAAMIRTDPAPSLPGEPPTSSGEYRASWKSTTAVVFPDAVVSYAYTDRRIKGGYLVWILEWGNEHIAPRPHVRPGVDNARPRIDRMLRQIEARAKANT